MTKCFQKIWRWRVVPFDTLRCSGSGALMDCCALTLSGFQNLTGLGATAISIGHFLLKFQFVWILPCVEYSENINVFFSVAIKQGIVFGDNTFSDLLLLVDYRKLSWIGSNLTNNAFRNFDKIADNLVIPVGLKVVQNGCKIFFK